MNKFIRGGPSFPILPRFFGIFSQDITDWNHLLNDPVIGGKIVSPDRRADFRIIRQNAPPSNAAKAPARSRRARPNPPSL